MVMQYWIISSIWSNHVVQRIQLFCYVTKSRRRYSIINSGNCIYFIPEILETKLATLKFSVLLAPSLWSQESP